MRTMQKPLELTKIQQRHTLSAKKKKQQSSLKNVLAQPFPRYWPQIDANERKELVSLLNEVKTSNPNYFARKKSDAPHPITYGLSSTLRSIKHGHVRVLILSADLKPRYVINQVILLALARNEAIDILCVPNLDHEMKSLVDFSCFAFAINYVDDSALHRLFAWCQTITSERYPVPELIREYFDSRRRRTSNEIESTPMEIDTATVRCDQGDDIPLGELHLTRSSTAPDQRAFIPRNAINFKSLSFEVTSLDKIKSDFISLNTFDSDDNSSKGINSSVSQQGEKKSAKGEKYTHIATAMKGDQRYQPAQIKRYSGNPAKQNKDSKEKLTREQRKKLRSARRAEKRDLKKAKIENSKKNGKKGTEDGEAE